MLHASIEYSQDMEFEDIIEYSLVDCDSDSVVKVGLLLQEMLV